MGATVKFINLVRNRPYPHGQGGIAALPHGGSGYSPGPLQATICSLV